jgi:hypothetical protein
VLTPGSFNLGSLDDVVAFAAFVVLQSKLLSYCAGTESWTTRISIWHTDRNLEFCLEAKGYPIGLLLAAQGSGFIQALEGFGSP